MAINMAVPRAQVCAAAHIARRLPMTNQHVNSL